MHGVVEVVFLLPQPLFDLTNLIDGPHHLLCNVHSVRTRLVLFWTSLGIQLLLGGNIAYKV